MPEAGEVILFAENSQQLIGMEVEMIHRVDRVKNNGVKIAERGPNLVTVLDALVSRDGHKNKIRLDSIKSNGSELGTYALHNSCADFVEFFTLVLCVSISFALHSSLTQNTFIIVSTIIHITPHIYYC